MLAYLLIFLITFFLLSPYGLLLSQFQLQLSLNREDFFWALQNTLVQALGSSLVSVLFGFLGGLGLLWLHRVCKPRAVFWLERAILLPNMVPSLFVIVACLGLINPFPYGRLGIMLVHAVINVGLVSVLFANLCLQKLESLGSLALVEGATPWQFIRVGVLGYLWPDLLQLFLFVFAICLVSFNVPFMVGGSQGTTLEVLIYETLTIDSNWSEALTLSLLQMLLVGIVSFWRRPGSYSMVVRPNSQLLQLAEWKWGALFPLITTAMVLLPPLFAFGHGLEQLQFLDFRWQQFLEPALFTLLMALGVGLATALLFVGICFGYEFTWWRRGLLMYLPPGAILVGFAFFIVEKHIHLPLPWQIVLGLTLVFFSSLFRLVLSSSLSGLLSQIEVAEVLGASTGMVFTRVILPQVLKPMMWSAGIASMWACGDFALSSVLSSEDFHLALLMKSLASNYRLDAAQVLMVPLYAIALVSFLFWWRLGDVLDRKFSR
jgi:thiamine transport system permease protein